MKKLILSLVALCALVPVLTGCGGHRELKELRGMVASVAMAGDSLTTMKVTVDADTLLLKLADARFTNGVMMGGDSVTVHYIEGRGDTLRALLVNVLPRAPRYFDPSEHGDTLLTAPARDEAAAPAAAAGGQE